MLPTYTVASGTDSRNTHSGNESRSRRRYSRNIASVPEKFELRWGAGDADA
ncbi:hypothetical protein MINTM008_15430 [Mycobacterium intracellulare]|uniref:Uncharacterized protein n=1 Tax=Mycobacterium paraintracellulare TaxID=1138383 RepID=A0ABN6ATW6_9MYCO|nr:hypothetical protein MPRI_31360 [Mycobacterium paraintracellulare]BCO45624.1 hypothetical protein MINTM002_12980 [Mycobacterium intracellulare]BCO40500.1 hypothetical protein MINTM001_16390 [Mycobacterium paraintracellulare]BCO50958.1 hypothetical protein MINTM003_13990 [Mycobacterium paraintracellulare]BCO56012.1 hypothetical protein MINTM005_12560 [Mycobacterium intracellulare]